MRAKGFSLTAVLVLVCFSLAISACDNNSSEGLNSEERGAIDTAFDDADDNMDGGLSGEEVVGALESEVRMEALDERGYAVDGRVSSEELTSHHDSFSTDGLSQEELNNIRKAFESSDGDIDRALEEKEILSVMDENKDGTISKEELINFHELVAISPRDVPKQFLMPVMDVFSIQGRGTVVTGRIESGEVYIGDDVELVGFTDRIRTTVTGIESFESTVGRNAGVGDEVGLLIRGVDREDVRIGHVLATPGLARAGQKFTANIRLFTTEGGGRSAPIISGYSPDILLRTARVTGTVTFPDGLEILFPGESAENIQIELTTPVAIEKDLIIDLDEGGRIIGAGTITEVTETE